MAADILDDKAALHRLRKDLLDLVASAGYDSMRWFPDASDVPLMTLALCGEVGELANLVKKIARGTHTAEQLRHQMRSELADVFTYYLGLCARLGVDPLADYVEKQRFNEERFGRRD